MKKIALEAFPQDTKKNGGVAAIDLRAGTPNTSFVSDMTRMNAGPLGWAYEGLSCNASRIAKEHMMSVAGTILKSTTR